MVVREGDFFRYERGIDLILRHKPKPGAGDRRIIAAYMIAHLRGTKRPHVEVMWRDEIDAIKARSQTGKDNMGPWKTDYAEMARKTVVRRGCKMLPMSVAMLNADEGKRFEQALAADDDDFEPEGTVSLEPQVIDVPAEASDGGLKGKARRKAADARAAAPEPAIDAEASAPEPRPLTPEEREAEQAEAHFAAEEKRKAAERAKMLGVPAPKKPAGPDEIPLADFKLQSPTSGAAPVERVAGEDDDS